MNKNKKINKEKTLALVLAGGLVTSTLNVVNTSADMIQDVNLVESVSTSNESVIPNQTLNFDKSKPSDITITGVKFNSKNLNSISITDENGKPQNIELSNVKKDESNGTITIPSNVISNLNLTVGVHAISVHFSDGSATIGAVSVNVIDSNSAVNPPKDDNTIVVPPVTPPSDDKNDKEDTITKKPTIEYQKLTFDMNNKQDLVVSNVNFDNTKLEYIYINGKEISATELKIENDKIIIPSNVISNVISVEGNYTISFKFSEGSSLINAVDIEVKDKNVILLDDMIDTAGTICNAANALKEFGAKEVYACCTHAVLSGPAIERIEASAISELIVLDTIQLPEEKKIDKIQVKTVAHLFGDAIKKIFANESISQLF